MITTIIFDLAEVYLKGLLGVEHYLEPIIGIKAEEIYPKLEGEELVALFHGEISEDEYCTRIIKKNNWEISVEIMKKAIRDNFDEIDGIREIIEKLKEMGFKLGLLSVHTKEWIDFCNKRFDYHKLFHSVSYSFEVSASKPDKKVYELILKKLGVKPKECIFIDDNPKNLVPARKLGITTIQFHNSGKLKKDFASLGITVN